MRTIVWFRDNDLRLSDHEPLWDAAHNGEVIPLWILDPEMTPSNGGADMSPRRQFYIDSLRGLEASIAQRGSRLIVVPGKWVEVLPRVVAAWRADRVVAHRSVDPRIHEQDEHLTNVLGSAFGLYSGETLLAPGSLRTSSGRPYSVFTQFARAFRAASDIGAPLPPPEVLPALPSDVSFPGTETSFLELAGNGRKSAFPGGEKAAQERLSHFVRHGLLTYSDDRNRMDLPGTSRLSADLRFGTLSVRQAWSAVHKAVPRSDGTAAFANELMWREFAYSTLWDCPAVLQSPFRPEFAGFPWRSDDVLWQAWVSGSTGYPVVDAAARQLLQEGFVPNRARMIAASCLTKDLLIDYRRGEAHYLEHLLDGDRANNNAGWQWSAGCGCDGQPYFRVFNPVIQGERFDPRGNYVRRWVPELAAMPAKYVHRPWEAPAAVLGTAGVRLGETYPLPIVDHRFARERFLAAARQHMRQQRSATSDVEPDSLLTRRPA